MAHIEEKPYEFLVRFEPSGGVRGAHFITREVRVEEGVEPEWLGRETVQPVTLGNYEGLPLSEVMTALQAAALAEVGTLRSQLAEAQAEIVRLGRLSAEVASGAEGA